MLGSIMALALSVSAHAAPVTFQLLDHPNGVIEDDFGSYGLRLDVGAPAARTFSVEDGPADVTLTVNDAAGRAFIVGTIHNDGSGDVGDPPASTFQVVQVFDIITMDPGSDGFEANAGLLYLLNDASFTDMADMVALVNTNYDALVAGTYDFGFAEAFRYEAKRQGGTGAAFSFLPDGHRLAGDDSSYVGRGWFNANGTNDWLVRAVQTPEPGTLLLLGAGMLLLARRRAS